MMTPLPPPHLGPYRLLRVVAEGARGTVCEASHPEVAHPLAVRLLGAEGAPDPDDAAAMRAACDAARRLEHPNIVALHDAGWHDGTAFVATEFVEGETLTQYLARVGRLPMLQALALATQLLAALECAHRHGQVHTAIHPGNLLVCRSGRLRVAGFGWIAALRALRSGRFDAAAYRAPEQGRRREVGDPRTDLYSAAVVAHQLLTGALPPSTQLPAAVQAVFDRALAAEPRARYAQAAELSQALQAAVGAPVWERPTPVRTRTLAPAAGTALAPRASTLPRPAGRRRRLRTGAALAAGCAAVVLLVAGLLGRGPAPAVAEPVVTESAEARQAAPPADPARVPPRADVAAALVPPAPPPVRPQPVALTPAPLPRLVAAPDPALAPVPRESRPAPRPTPAAQAPTGARQPVTSPPRPESRTTGARPKTTTARAPSERKPRPSPQARADLGCRQDLAIAREICTAVRCVAPRNHRHPVCMRLQAERRALDAQRELFGSN